MCSKQTSKMLLSEETEHYVMTASVQWDCTESVFGYHKAEFDSENLHQASASQGSTKHLLVSRLFAMSSASFCITCIVEDMWREGETEGEGEMKTKLKRTQKSVCLAQPSRRCSPQNILLTNLILWSTAHRLMSCGSVFKSVWGQEKWPSTQD